MTGRSHDPRRLDVRALAADAATVQGTQPAENFTRLQHSVSGAMAPDSDVPVIWSAVGALRTAAGAPAEVWMHLRADTAVRLICQRCLQPLTDALIVDRRYQFVASESEAEYLDEISEHEVLVLARTIDLFDLLEDELILALPIVPRHGVCPQPLVLGGIEVFSPEQDEAPHPFAALAGLRKPPLNS